MQEAHEIIPRLWLGDVRAAKNRTAIVNSHINVVINCTKDIPFADTPAIKFRYRIPVDDNPIASEFATMTQTLNNLLPVMHWHYLRGDRMLVHCAMGAQRSAFVVLAYLYRYHIHDIAQSYWLIRQRRPIAFCTGINFAPCLLWLFGPKSIIQITTIEKK